MSDYTKAERASIRQIVRARFKALRQQLPLRAEELIEQIQAELDADAGGPIAEANDEGARLQAELDEINERVRRHVAYWRAKGLTQGKYHSLTHWRSERVTEEIQKKVQTVHRERRRLETALTQQELGMIELLLVQDLKSTEAIGFLAQIPTIEQALPAPEIQQQLEM